uniref:Uncharacterized protein n=1 Tax=Arion vulgaris TaxID=1028688 RepID=A0A0B7AVZ4_9EUPU
MILCSHAPKQTSRKTTPSHMVTEESAERTSTYGDKIAGSEIICSKNCYSRIEHYSNNRHDSAQNELCDAKPIVSLRQRGQSMSSLSHLGLSMSSYSVTLGSINVLMMMMSRLS